ncbi:MAG: ABC transporter substrate-binding protein [Christensenellales bacterium]|jgi:peptide/nickel transport system substrate-binding protein
MRKLSLVVVLAMLLSLLMPVASFAEEMTEVGTPRSQTLIAEPDDDVCSTPGQFNPYMTGTRASWGAHQIMWDDGLWDVNTMSGEAIPTIAASAATPNEDFTEWTIPIRQGLKWSDGETLDANDVFFTFNMIMTNTALSDNAYYNSIFTGAELIDDYTLKITCKEPYPRLMTRLGVSSWGCGFRVVPEHVYSQVDVTTFTDSAPVVSGAYTVKEYDPLGTWILYEKRADWQNTVVGQLYGEPVPQYVLYRVFGNTEARVMAMINNQVDIMNEISYEDLQLMMESNENVRAWYEDFPFATTDDACSKGVYFNCGVEPFNDVNVRWALTLCCDWIEVSENIFDGIGRMSALTVPAITIQVENYYKPMQDWLTNEFTILDGTYNPWNPNFALELRDALVADYGYDLADKTDEEVITMFGTGYWKTDKEKATGILSALPDFELKDGTWYYKGQPWTIKLICHTEEGSTQASRSGKAIADQWSKFGINVEVSTLTAGDMSSRLNLGDYEVATAWYSCCSYFADLYNNISGWDDTVYKYPLGEVASGISALRFSFADPELSAKITEVVKKASLTDPNGEEIKALMIEYLKLTTEAHISVDVHSGTKIVPINTTYWTGLQTAENPYEGPWWWWSCFKFSLPKLVSTVG